MCTTTNPKQKFILENINTFSFEEINAFLVRGIEISCLIKYEIKADLLNKLDVDILKEQLKKESVSKDQLIAAGMNQTLINSLFNIDDDVIEDEDDDDLGGDDLGGDDLGEDHKRGGKGNGMEEMLIEQINKGQITVGALQEQINEGSISEQTLRNRCSLSDQMIKRIQNYSPQQMPHITLSELPKLKEGCTDFYFLGMPSAGKSCLIASLLTHWMRTGICNPETSNPRGIKYFRLLGGGFSKGILPRNNPNTFIDHIEITLNINQVNTSIFGSKNKKYHIPINILDMAGEKFDKVAENGVDYFTQHKDFLINENSKALFFVLDYSMDNEGQDAFDQALSLTVVLNYLEDLIKGKTDTIFLIVTKADLFPVSKEKYHEYAEQYIDDYYASFKRRLDDLKESANIQYEILPYSIGGCVFGQLLEDFNPRTNDNLVTYPAKLSKEIEKLTARYNKSWFSL